MRLFNFSFWLVLFPLFTLWSWAAPDVNILVIGSATDSSSLVPATTATLPFDPEKVADELSNILKGATGGEVNVVFEDLYKKEGEFRSANLLSWFYFPYPEDIEVNERWPNLRGELYKKWDYVVLIGDAHTIEYLPGFYALGVSEIGKEVAKSNAETKTVLLMPWPAEGSESNLQHYKEVVYRVGRSGGGIVAPAGLVWEKAAAGGYTKESGAYLAAATLFSRISLRSASVSSYRYDRELAGLAHKAVLENKGAVQYKGRFATPHPHSAQFNANRKVRYSFTGTSTERSHMERLRTVMDACRVEYDDSLSNRYETNDPLSEKGGWSKAVENPIDFNLGKFGFGNYGEQFNVNPDYWKRAYCFQYQGHLASTDESNGKIAHHDLAAGVKAYQQEPYLGATIPRAAWALLQRRQPDLKMKGSGNHLSPIAILPNASFIYTCDSGRCPLTPRQASPSSEWHALSVGYEAGWTMSRLQARAPGFRFLPSAADKHELNNYLTTGGEEMAVQFIFKPQAPVTVHLMSSHPDLIEITPSTRVFTPDNYDVEQSYRVSIVDGSPSMEKEITVTARTVSEDEVYHELSDSWLYTAKVKNRSDLPLATKDQYRTGVNQKLTRAAGRGLLANDINHPQSPVVRLHITKGVSHGVLELANDGSFVYTPEADFKGRDVFYYSVINTNGSSEPASVTVEVSDLDPSLIVWYDFKEINGIKIKDLTTYGRDGTMIKSVPQVAGPAEGQVGVDLNQGSIGIPIDDEYYDLVDRELAVSFWAYLDPVTSDRASSTLLKGTKTYDGHVYDSLSIRFKTDTKTDISTVFWQNGIFKQGGRATSYKILNTQKHSRGRIPLTPETLNGQWVHWTFMINRDTSFFNVYKDGVLAFKGSLAGALAFGLVDEIDDLVLGDSFKGKVADFRIYNREISVLEMKGIMAETGSKRAESP